MIDLPNLLLSYGIELRKQGNEYKCLCFAHDDHNPSMSIYTNSNGEWTAHCFACGEHADVYAVYCKLNGLDTTNPVHFLQAKAECDGEAPLDTGKRHAKIISAPNNVTELAKRVTMQPPADASPPKMDYLTGRDGTPWGAPDHVYTYRTPEGAPWYYEARWNNINGRKECRCFTYGKRGEAEPARWSCAHYDTPRPLYGLDRVAATAGQVVITEGPRKAHAAQMLLPQLACVGWAGGALGWRRSDWTPIAGRSCILWPDADDVGRKAMADLAQHLTALGCECSILNTEGLQNAWDSADAVAEGWIPEQTLAWARSRKGETVKLAKIDSGDNHADFADVSIYDLPPMPEDDIPPMGIKPPEIIVDGAFTDDAGMTWTEPGDVFSEITAPGYREEFAPACLREWIADTAGVKGVDPSILFVSSLVAVAACLHDDIQIQPEHTNPSWRESARLWGAVVGSSGIKKSPAIGAAISRVKKIQHDLSAQASDLELEYKAKDDLYQTQLKEYVKLLSKKDPTAIKPIRPEYPEIPRLYFEDVTVEKLADSLKASRRGCIVVRDELAGFFAFNQYKGGQGGDAAAWLEFYEGGPRYTDRINRGSVFTPNWGGCVLGGIQPTAMQRIVDTLPEDGMMQRFIIINAKIGSEGNGKPYNKAANDNYHDILQQIFDTVPSPDAIHLSSDANEIRKEVTRHAFKLIRANLVSSGLCSHLAKYEGLFARLALTYHAIHCADRRIHPQSCQISGETAETVKKLMLRYLLPHAISFYLNINSHSHIGHAIRKIAELCLVAKTGDIANRDMLHGWVGWRHYKPHEQDQVLQTLVDQSWIMPHPNARLSSRGMPTRYLINPHLAEIHAARKADELERRAIATAEIAACRAEFNESGITKLSA